VAVSYYHYLIKVRVIDETYPLTAFVEQFLIGAWDPFGSWGENVGSWIGARESSESFLLLRYEDMLRNTMAELAKVRQFLELDASDDDLARAVELSSFERMRELEQTQAKEWSALSSARKDGAFVRSGKAEAWRLELDDLSISRINQRWGRLMTNLGYDA
jgi:hypothetical protein